MVKESPSVFPENWPQFSQTLARSLYNGQEEEQGQDEEEDGGAEDGGEGGNMMPSLRACSA